MKTEIINIKTDRATKVQAHKIADELGFSLGTVINAYLRQLIKNKAVYFSTDPQQELSEWLKRELAQGKQDAKAGYVSPRFDNFEDSVAWLKQPRAKYLNGKYAYRIRKAIQKKF